MSKLTLKDILKPPFKDSGCGMIIDAQGITCLNDSDSVVGIRGGGFFSHYEKGDKLQDEWTKFVVAALNEKWAREYGERKRWIKAGAKIASIAGNVYPYFCPVCRFLQDNKSSYCPYCGEPLDPPEEEEDNLKKELEAGVSIERYNQIQDQLQRKEPK